MRKSNIALYLNSLKSEEVLALMRNVVAKMTGNANFATPAVKLVDLTAKADELAAAIEAATFGSRSSKLLRNQLQRESGAMLTMQANYVRSTCEGDEVMLSSSGFALAKQHQPLPPPQAPQDVKVVRTVDEGVLKLQWKAERGTMVYYVDMQEEGSTTWTRILTTGRVKHTISGLTTGKEYSFRVQVLGKHGLSGMSETVTQRAA